MIIAAKVRVGGRTRRLTLAQLLALLILNKEKRPMTVYAILKRIREMSAGVPLVGHTTMYTQIKWLEDGGLIEDTVAGFRITRKGEAILREAMVQGELEGVVNTIKGVISVLKSCSSSGSIKYARAKAIHKANLN